MTIEFTKMFINHTHSLPWNSHKKGSLALSAGQLFIKKIPLWKRVFDIMAALIGLIVLSPLFLLCGLFIKVVSPGPIFFKQERIGCGSKPFNCFKFRTMTMNAEINLHKEYLAVLIDSCNTDCTNGDPMTKLQKDPRIIRYGNFLRASGLDELPQLINVLLGQMSLVGPRPPIRYEVEKYKHWYNNRFDVVPGLTGLWQVSGKNRLGFNEMIRLDIQYAMKRSFLLDCKILLMTPFVIYDQIKELGKKCTIIQDCRSSERR